MEKNVDELSLALQQMQSNLKKVYEEHSERIWLQTGKNMLNERLRGNKSLDELSKDIVDFLVSYSVAQIGTMYIMKEDALHLEYAYGIQKKIHSTFYLGEGLIGQAAVEKSLKILTKLPPNYLKVASSLGQEKPDHVVILPIVFNNTTISVIELAKFGEFSDVQVKLLKEISESIAIAINTALNQQSLKELLDKLSAQKNQIEKSALELNQQVDCLNNAAIVSIADSNGDIIYVNEKFCEISKYPREELLGKNHRILKSGKQSDGLFIGMWKAISMGKVWSGEILNKAKDGTLYWVDTTITPFKGIDGKIEKYVAIRFDITDTKNKKSEVEAITTAVYKSNIAVEFDLNGRILKTNEIFLQTMGYEENELLGKHHSIFVEKGYEKSQEYIGFWDELKRGGSQEAEFKGVTKSGEIVWIKGNYNPIFDLEGKPYKILKIASDVTLARKQAEELRTQQEELKQLNQELEEQAYNLKQKQAELQQTNKELEEQTHSLEIKNMEVEAARIDIEQKTRQLEISSKYKSEFLANMSHELRTPLNSLLILSKDLADNKRKNLSAEEVESAEIIHRSGQDLLGLINEVLDLSKIEAGKMALNIGRVSLKEFASNLGRNFKHQADKKGLKLNISLGKDLPEFIRTDPQRLDQVLKNLVSNAIKFTNEGSINVSIARKNKDHIIIAVTDTGIGVPKDKQEAIFEAFHQGDGSTSRKYGGTGLGLSISRDLTKLLGGEISLASKVGDGSTFAITLPIELKVAETFSDSPITRDSSKTIPPAIFKKNNEFIQYPTIVDDREDITPADRVVLIIEDDLKFAGILLKQAHVKNFKGITASTGEDGLLLAAKYQPHAIILDLVLPGIDGHHVLAELKENTNTRHIPVHIISTSERNLDQIQGRAIAYLAKPVNKKQMEAAFDRIEDFINRKIKNLLIVEDNEDARVSIKKLLGNGDIKCLEAGTGQEAMITYKKHPIDCIVLDLGLPDINGLDLIQQFEGLKVDGKPPIIIYTGKELSKEENEHLKKYAESIIIKGEKSEERLLDETALFLHRAIDKLPEFKQKMIANLHDTNSVFMNKKILVVDDDMRNVFALSKVLKERGMQIMKAANGMIALQILDNEPDIDLVLMDIMMPEMDGYEAMRKIRSQDRFNKLPVIALTAKAMAHDKQKCMDAGANDYIHKPVDIERLHSLMRVWLNK
jgi:PAS domain S-box-containing protein